LRRFRDEHRSFYGSSTCYTEMAAEKIRDIIGPELVTLHNLKDDSPP
jgi:flavodoxin II